MPSDPIDKRPLESDIMSDLFGLEPFVPQDFGFLGLKLPVKGRGGQGIEGLVELSWFHTHRHRPVGFKEASASRRPVNARILLKSTKTCRSGISQSGMAQEEDSMIPESRGYKLTPASLKPVPPQMSGALAQNAVLEKS